MIDSPGKPVGDAQHPEIGLQRHPIAHIQRGPHPGHGAGIFVTDRIAEKGVPFGQKGPEIIAVADIGVENMVEPFGPQLAARFLYPAVQREVMAGD